MRVNARLEGEYERQVEFLTETTGLGVTDVIKASIEHYYRSFRTAGKPRFQHLRPLVGKQDSGHSDVSSRTKELFASGVAGKHGKSRGSAK